MIWWGNDDDRERPRTWEDWAFLLTVYVVVGASAAVLIIQALYKLP